MADSGFLIDLGVDFAPVPEEPWAASWPRTARRLRLAAAACAVFFLVAAGAAAPVLLRLVMRVPVGLNATVMVAAGDLYLYDVTGFGNLLRAYPLDGGDALWGVALPELPSETTVVYLDGRIVVSSAATDAKGEHTTVLDPRTGAQLWASQLGFAVAVTGGVLVESAPPPPGYNYTGTNRTTSFSLLDAVTGRPRWSVDLGGDCLTRTANPVGGQADTLVALCVSEARLTEISLADGRVTASRPVDLGDPGRNFLLPAPDRLADPQLGVVGDTVLVAHADAPAPAVDGYAMAGLDRRWSGAPILAGQHIDRCGAALCVLGDDGSGPVVDPVTGTRIGRVPPSTGPGNGTLVLTAVGGAAVVAVPVAAAGTGVAMLSADPHSSTAVAVALARWHTAPPDGPASAVPIQLLPGVRTPSCVQVATYLACATPAGLALWQL